MATAWVDSLPNKLRIGAHDFKISKMEKSWGNSAETLRYGDFSEVNLTIRIRRHMRSRTHAVDTIIHEVMHALWCSYSLQKGDSEERVIGAMAIGLTQVLRDNVAFADWLANMSRAMRGRLAYPLKG